MVVFTAPTGKRWALLTLLIASSARANGAFPAVSQLVADPSQPAHLVLRSNFGLLTTRDRGQTWDLVCEAGVGYENVEPPIAVLSDGTTIAALPTGVAHGVASECAFSVGAGLSGYVADVARVPNAPSQAIAVSVDIDASTSRVWRSLDGGGSWAPIGGVLGDLNAATLDAATDDPRTFYVSGVSQAGSVKGVLARSSDAGGSWQRYDVPGVSKVSAPYIAAVATEDRDTVYVRLSGTPGRLLVTHDGGQHFDPVLDFEGPLDGFALSPDGRFALAAGRLDGVWRASTTSLAFERLSCARLRCLSWTSSGLFACADESQAGFLVGESLDEGASFEARLHLSCVRGPLACDGESSVSRACTPLWPGISERLGTDCAAAGSFVPSTACTAGVENGLAGSSNAGAMPRSPFAPRGGKGCAFCGHAPPAASWLWFALQLGWVAHRRKQRRERFHDTAR